MNSQIQERYELSIARIREMKEEDTVAPKFLAYFQKVSEFLLLLEEERRLLIKDAYKIPDTEDAVKRNERLYRDVLPGCYPNSYANPAYAVRMLGAEYGQLLCAVYAELRSGISYVYESSCERQLSYLAILNELFIELYVCFEEEELPDYETVRNVFYWYASDYCDVFLSDRIEEQLNPEPSFAVGLMETADLSGDAYLYQYGEYISENELGTARHLRELPEQVIQTMADVYTEGYRQGFLHAGIDLSRKKTVTIRYALGFERVIKAAIRNFQRMGLEPAVCRSEQSVITRQGQSKNGYYGGTANKQYEYDHRADQGLILDKKYVERKLDVTRNTYEKYKSMAEGAAGPAVMEVFGEAPFVPAVKKEAVSLSEKQEQLSLFYRARVSRLINQYIRGEERSYTIVAYPVPEIGKDYKAIFDDVIMINTLDSKAYERIQQHLIDALDQGEAVHVKGTRENGTDLTIRLAHLEHPEAETIFENCVADVNIPVGEVFTTPVLAGTDGVLCVSKVYLNELQYQGLHLTFQDGKIIDYTCKNFESEEDNRHYVREHILHNHETLPLGEFAIGTNTTAYAAAKKYQIADKMPILIAEKMGPHFAVGDTCYSFSEENRIYNPDGKEVIAKDNELSVRRKENAEQAYFQCHTDITIPYEELEEIKVLKRDGTGITLLRHGRFVLEGTEILNQPLEEQLTAECKI